MENKRTITWKYEEVEMETKGRRSPLISLSFSDTDVHDGSI